MGLKEIQQNDKSTQITSPNIVKTKLIYAKVLLSELISFALLHLLP